MSYLYGNVENNYIAKNEPFKILEYLFVLITIFQCNSVYFYLENSIFRNSIRIFWHVFLLLLLIFLFINTVRIKDRSISKFFNYLECYVGFVIVLFLINLFNYKFSFSLMNYFFESICLFVLFYMLFLCNDFNSLMYKFEFIIIILSIISLFFWALSILKTPTNMSIQSIGDGGINSSLQAPKVIPGYFYIHFLSQGKINFLGLNLIRNTGIFVEAPVYSSVLDIALFIELFLKSNTKVFNYKVILLFVTICSTTSTNGIIIGIMAIVYAKIINLFNNGKLDASYVFVIPIIVTIALIIVCFIIINKATSSTVLSSFNIRMNDFYSTLSAWRNHIFIGNGFNNNESIIKHMAMWRFASGGTTSVSIGFTRILAYGGLLLGLFYSLPLFLAYKISSKVFGFGLFSFILLILEGIDTFYIFFMILAYLWIRFIIKQSYTHIYN